MANQQTDIPATTVNSGSGFVEVLKGTLGASGIDGIDINPFVSTNSILQAWLDGLTGAQPSAGLKTDLNTFLNGLANNNILTEHDILIIMAGMETTEQALKPFITTGVSPAVNNSCSFSSAGFLGNGSSQYLDYNWNPSTNGVKYTRDDASIYFFNDQTAVGGGFSMGAWNGGVNAVLFEPRFAGVSAGSINAALYSFTPSNPTTSVGLYTMRRTGSTASASYKDAALTATSSDASTAVVNLKIFGNAINSSGSAGFYNADLQGLFGAGSSLITAAIVSPLWYAYKTSRGF